SKRNRVVLFGGRDYYTFNEVWELSLDRAPSWGEIVTQGLEPPELSAHTAVLDAARDRMLVFGGLDDENRVRNELWALSLSGAPTWSQVSVSGSVPDARQYHSAVYDPARDRMIVFGGLASNRAYDDVWALSPADPPQWTRILTSNTPGARYGHSAV